MNCPLFQDIIMAGTKRLDKVFIFDGENKISYRKFYEDILRLKKWEESSSLDFNKLIIIKSHTNYITILLSIFLISRGYIVSLLNHKFYHLKDNISDNCEIETFTIEASEISNIEQTLNSTQTSFCEDELLNIFAEENKGGLVFFSSGSTSNILKGILSAKANIVFSSQSIQSVLNYQENDRIACLQPVSFDMAYYQVFLCLLSGAGLYLNPIESNPNIIQYLDDNNITTLPVSPSVLEILIALKRKINSQYVPSTITLTGERFNPVQAELTNLYFNGAKIFSMYGLTECKRISILHHEEYIKKPLSVGKPIPGINVYVKQADGQLARFGSGECVVVGNNVTQGYINDKNLTNERFFLYEGKKALLTGDIIEIDHDGYIYYLTRKDDQIKRNGIRFYPNLIINKIISEFSLEYAKYIQDRDGCVVLIIKPMTETNISERNIYKFISENFEPHMLPDKINVIDKLVYNSNYKKLSQFELDLMK